MVPSLRLRKKKAEGWCDEQGNSNHKDMRNGMRYNGACKDVLTFMLLELMIPPQTGWVAQWLEHPS